MDVTFFAPTLGPSWFSRGNSTGAVTSVTCIFIYLRPRLGTWTRARTYGSPTGYPQWVKTIYKGVILCHGVTPGFGESLYGLHFFYPPPPYGFPGLARGFRESRYRRHILTPPQGLPHLAGAIPQGCDIRNEIFINLRLRPSWARTYGSPHRPVKDSYVRSRPGLVSGTPYGSKTIYQGWGAGAGGFDLELEPEKLCPAPAPIFTLRVL